MAISTYPAHLASEWQAPDGTVVKLRPIRSADAAILREFFHSLSPEARYLRFMSTIKELTPEMLAQFTQVDYSRDMALIAVVHDHGRGSRVCGLPNVQTKAHSVADFQQLRNYSPRSGSDRPCRSNHWPSNRRAQCGFGLPWAQRRCSWRFFSPLKRSKTW